MPKKNKKKTSSSASAGGGSGDRPPGPATSQQHSQHHDDSLEPLDMISLEVIKSSTPPYKTLKYVPTILMVDEDAQDLDVQTGDDVFLLVIQLPPEDRSNDSGKEDDEAQLTNAAVARAHVVHSERTPKSTPKSTPTKKPWMATMTSPTTSKSSSTQVRSKLTPGNCHIFPVSLATSLFNNTLLQNEGDQDDDDDNNGDKESLLLPSGPINKTPQQTPPVSSSSSSKSKLSFASGGGGDALISTTPSKTPTPTKSKQGASTSATPKSPTPSSFYQRINSKNQKLIIVPVDSELGDYLGTNIFGCHNANSIEVVQQLLEKERPQPKLLLQEGPLCERLILAHTAGAYASRRRTTFRMSYQGQSLTCRILNIVGEKEEDLLPATEHQQLLVQDFLKLSLDPTQAQAQPRAPVTSFSPFPPLPYTFNGDYSDELRKALATLVTPKKKKTLVDKLQLYQITNSTKVTIIGITNKSKKEVSVDEEKKEEHKGHSSPKTFVAGLDSILEDVQSWLHASFQHYQLSGGGNGGGIKPPKGLLLHGPSGTGKSALANQIVQNWSRSSSTYNKIHIQHIHCTTLQSQTSVVGQAEKQLVTIFENAIEHQRRHPQSQGSLIVLDDIHLICPKRQGMNIGTDRLSSTLLALLDGVEDQGNLSQGGGKVSSSSKNYPIVILAITTNPSLLDPALRRPGRLDSEIEIPVPVDPRTRQKILEYQLANLKAQVSPTLTDNEWLQLARQAKGFTGADLKLAVKECIRNAATKSITLSSSSYQSGDDGIIMVSKVDLERAVRSTKPSAIKAVTVEIPQVHWSSIGGMEDAKRSLREAIELPLTHGAMFARLGIQPPRGVLLYGPPGCSKTLMARALATEGHMNFLAVKGPELLSKWLGESERTLASLFKRARLASPSVIFFDEVDAIASKRSGNSSGGERLLSQMLTELDGIQKQDTAGGDSDDNNTHQRGRVVVVCATNRPDLLDNAVGNYD